ncbi:MAG: amidinotransferase [Candidatus Aminicenantes bacterium]|nr:MAG: amidinotransferase [Candidatus Aminicenantes bacterium]
MEPTKTKKEWLSLKTSISEDFSEYWGGNWGCDSEVGKLRAVLLRRPGKEIEAVTDPEEFRWLEAMDVEIAREQHDAFAEAYRSQGVEVHYVEKMRDDRPNALFMRDNVLMTPQGAIVGRQAMACRRGEERYAAEALARLGVPIVRTISGMGIFETACCLWVDAGTVIIGTGNRANKEGALQVEQTLRSMGVEHFLHLQIPHGYAHIDSIISFVDKKTAVFDPVRIPWDIWTALKNRGFKLFEAPSLQETKDLALNFVALNPGRILMAAGFPETKELLQSRGIAVHEVEISELRKGWGSLHCMTTTLKREPIGSLD